MAGGTGGGNKFSTCWCVILNHEWADSEVDDLFQFENFLYAEISSQLKNYNKYRVQLYINSVTVWKKSFVIEVDIMGTILDRNVANTVV